MIAKPREMLVPGFLLLCLLLGGSAQGIWANLILQLAAIAILAWAAAKRPAAALPRAARSLLLLAGAMVVLVAMQLVPLPPGLAIALPGRAFVADGLALLNVPQPWLPLSLTPYETVAAGFFLLVPLAVLAAMLRQSAFSPPLLALAVIAGSLLGTLLAVLQVSSGGSDFYLYRHSAFAAGAGFFANSNHMATLLLACVPFLLALAADFWDRRRDRPARTLVAALTAAGVAVLAVAIALNGSFAILLLGVPVGIASVMIPAWQRRPQLRKWLVPMGLVLTAATVVLGIVGHSRPAMLSQTSFESRTAIWSTSADALGGHMLAGAGLGSFPGLYRGAEDPGPVDTTYVNHAHNDYLELAIEAGVPGLILLGLFLIWWVRRVFQVWQREQSDYYARAASIASAAILLHSLVDFPLRTAGIAALLAMCAGLLARRSEPALAKGEGDLWASRHLSID
jgi:O-antigen ligase